MHSVQTMAKLKALHEAGAGFVLNDFTSGPAGAGDNVIHSVGCVWVGRMLSGADPGSRPSVRKIAFAVLGEAISWLAANRGAEGTGWKRCATCRPGGTATDGRPSRYTDTPSGTRHATDSWTAGAPTAASQRLTTLVDPSQDRAAAEPTQHGEDVLKHHRHAVDCAASTGSRLAI